MIFEDVTTSFLNEQFADVLNISSVDVLSQSIVETNEGRRKLSMKSNLRRRLQSSSLQIELEVEGTVLDQQALDALIESSSDKSISSVIEENMTSNYDELSKQLSGQSNFFPRCVHVYIPEEMGGNDSQQLVCEEVVSSPLANVEQSSGIQIDRNQLIAIITGGAIALLVLIGSIFVMERRSAAAKRRRILEEQSDDDDEGMKAYDLNDLTYHREESGVSDMRTSQRTEAAVAPMKMPIKPKRRSSGLVKEARMMPSIVDTVSL